jgi:1-acyl-sn-glycerol-3-phosphate acyltransferase
MGRRKSRASMILLRSLLYTITSYALLALIALALLPRALLGGRATAIRAAQLWSRSCLFGLRIICGTRYELRGAERLPKGPALVACKHQAMWETLLLTTLFKDPAFVLKQELLSLPIFGWYARKADMIAVAREEGAAALKSMLRAARAKIAQGRPLIIFPEGTRQEPGAPPDYKPGIAALYRALDVPCVPIALNSGLYWQGKGILRRPGTILVEVLEAIPPGLSREAFMAELQERIETASARLLDEARAAA